MARRSRDDRAAGLPQALRDAVERTFSATAGQGAESRERAGEVLDELVRRGQGAREAATGASREARASVEEAGREALSTVEDAGRAAREEIERLERRVRELERKLNPKAKG